jgi:hypothetical protein
MIRRVVVLAMVAILPGCSLLSGRCLYELRSATAEGTIQVSGADSAFASVMISEQRDYEPDKDLSWQVRAPSLKGKVTAIKLVDQAGAVRYDLGVDATASPQLSGGFVRQSDGASINGFFDLLSSYKAKVVITLDTGSSITIPLNIVRKYDWNRPYCS